MIAPGRVLSARHTPRSLHESPLHTPQHLSSLCNPEITQPVIFFSTRLSKFQDARVLVKIALHCILAGLFTLLIHTRALGANLFNINK